MIRERMRSRVNWASVARNVGYVLLTASIGIFLIALVNQSPWVMSLASLCICLAFASFDLSRASKGEITPATLYALSLAATSAANMIAFLSADGPNRSLYFLYVVEDQLLLSTMLTLAGAVFPIVGFHAITKHPLFREGVRILPDVSWTVSDSRLVGGALVLTLLSYLLRSAGTFPGFGTISFLILAIPTLAAFTLARAGAARRVPRAIIAALAIAVAESVRAAFQAYLRVEIVTPLFAFVAGTLLGARSFAPMLTRHFVPIYLAGTVFVLYFGTFGELRSETTGGLDRLSRMYEYQGGLNELEAEKQQPLHSRLTDFNQMSQVARLVREDGYLDGQTLEYLGFAFIPRFLWPGKPLIAKGSWFAMRIGQARIGQDGKITNSINMTIPGELYLNFGWMGVILGGLFFGGLMGVLWHKTNFWSDTHNVLGSAFGFYLLSIAAGTAADLQIIVTMIAAYLVFAAAGSLLRSHNALRGSPLPARATFLRKA